jgi:hypothetical protein
MVKYDGVNVRTIAIARSGICGTGTKTIGGGALSRPCCFTSATTPTT